MFGGVGFILNSNMACGVLGSDLIVRVGSDKYSAALSQAYAKPFLTPGGKLLSGWVLAAMQGLEADQELRQWVEQGYQFALSLPEKK
jgi:TfoX/Sxy family transcriptional regulator of competence genes